MINAFRFLGDVMKSHVVQAILTVLSGEKDKPITGEIADAVKAAADAVPSDAVIANNHDVLRMSMRSWSADEVNAAAAKQVNGRFGTSLSVGQSPFTAAEAVFKAGAEWALAHQRDSLATAHNDFTLANIGATALKDAAGVATAFATGGESAALATAVGEAAQAVGSLATSAQDGKTATSQAAPAPAPSATGAEPAK